MTYATYNSQYIENDILSRSPEWLIPLLYEHLIANLNRAVVEIELGNRPGATASLGKGSRILFELLSCLDLERGGEIAEGLASLYAFYAREIVELSRAPEPDRLQRLIAWASDLHESWVAAAEAVAPRTRATQAA